MYQVLKEQHFRYDASGVNTKPDTWPTKNEDGLWLFSLGQIPLAGTRNVTIAMDYNFFSAQSQARDVVRHGSPAWERDYQQTLKSYENYFEKNYNGNRAPVIIGHHFSTWNDGMYWQTLKDFAQETCGKPEVYCVNFRELVNYLDNQPS